MKQLYYKNEYYKNITDEEATSITNHKGIQISFKGELLKKSQIEIRNGIKDNEERRMVDFSTDELKNILGSFEKEYNENATGETIHNEVLGFVKQGNVNHALRLEAITEHKNVYYVKLPEYRNYDLKVRTLNELNCRRAYAKKMNKQDLSELENKMSF